MTVDRRVLVVGSGGREHALCWRLAQDSRSTPDGAGLIMVAPGNPGMTDVARIVPVGVTDTAGILELVRREAIELVIIGPEAPLVDGLADRLREAGVAVVGPDAAAARLEGSKSFCREVAAAAGVPIAVGATFQDVDAAIDYARARAGRVVVKADGLAAGKGVAVCADMFAAERAIRDCLVGRAFGDAGSRIVIEEVLQGREVSVIALCDESAVLALPAARDHKRLRDDDAGPNTGGMGAISPVDEPSDDDVARILDTIHRPILAELARRGMPFRGVLFAGLMLTHDGPRLLECNVRFGDPETQATLPRLATPLLPLLGGVARGRLADAAAAAGIAGPLLPVHPDASVAVVVAAAGYPEAPRTGDPVRGIAAARSTGALVFCAGVTTAAHGTVTSGGRVLAVVGQGTDPDAAIASAYAAVEHIDIPGMQIRRDIGRTGVPVGAAGVRSMIPRYSLPEMAGLWTDQARFGSMLRVELAVLDVLAQRGVVPEDAVRLIESRGRVDVDRIAELEQTTDHDVIAFVSQVAETVGDAGRWLHFGLTSSDVVDTGLALQCQAAGALLGTALDEAIETLVGRAREHARTLQMGRTHSVHAEPITFGLKLASWAFELDRDRTRLRHATADLATGKISGPVGTYSQLGPDVEAAALAALGLAVDPVSTQIVQRDRHAAFLAAIAVTGGSIERFATEVRNLQHTEIAELQEPFRAGQKGSSAMPHKRNPILSERLAGLARLLRGFALAGLEDQALWHERDISHSSVERVVLPGATTLLHYMLVRFRGLVAGLVVRPGTDAREHRARPGAARVEPAADGAGGERWPVARGRLRHRPAQRDACRG